MNNIAQTQQTLDQMAENNKHIKSYDLYDEYDKCRATLKDLREDLKLWLNTPWFCFNCGKNMDEKLKKMIGKINKVLDDEI